VLPEALARWSAVVLDLAVGIYLIVKP